MTYLPTIFKAHLKSVMHDSPHRSFTQFGIKVEHEPVPGVHQPHRLYFRDYMDPLYGPYGRPGRPGHDRRGPMDSTFRISEDDFRILQHLFLREHCSEIEVLQPTRDFVVLQTVTGHGCVRWQAAPNHIVAKGGQVVSYFLPEQGEIPHGRFIESDRRVSSYSPHSFGVSDFEDSVRMMRDLEYQFEAMHGAPIARIPARFLDVPRVDPIKFAAQVAELMKPASPAGGPTVEDAARQVVESAQKSTVSILLAAPSPSACKEVLAEAILKLDPSARFNTGRWLITWKNGSKAKLMTTAMQARLRGPRYNLAWVHGDCTNGFLQTVATCGKPTVIQSGRKKLPDSHKGLGVMFGREDLV